VQAFPTGELVGQMKFGMLRKVAAAVVGVAVVLPASTQPARAQDNDAYIDVAIEVLSSLLDKAADGGVSPSEVLLLVQELKGAIDGVKVDVVARLDAQVVTEVRARTDAAVAKVHFLNNRFTAGPYAVQVAEAAYLARSYVDLVNADRDLDGVGRAMMTLFTISGVAEEKLGSVEEDRRRHFANYRQGLERLISRMAPQCHLGAQPRVDHYWYTCTFNGRTVRADQIGGQVSIDGQPPIAGPINHQLVQDLVMWDTAERLAKDALEEMRRRGY